MPLLLASEARLGGFEKNLYEIPVRTSVEGGLAWKLSRQYMHS